jgi:hypothetical protein
MSAWAPATPSQPRQQPRLFASPERSHNFEVPNIGLYQRDRCFLDFLHPKLDEGWKLHVPVNDQYGLNRDYQRIFEYLQYAKVPHKFVSDPHNMVRMERGGQHGKFLTVYPDDADQAVELAAIIDVFLDKREYTYTQVAPGDRPVFGNELVTARYGGLTGPWVLKPEVIANPGDNGPTTLNCYRPDDRTRYKPDYIKDPFDRTSTGIDGGYQYPVSFTGRNYDTVVPKQVEGQIYNPKTLHFEPDQSGGTSQ